MLALITNLVGCASVSLIDGVYYNGDTNAPVADEVILQASKIAKINELKLACTTAIQAGFTSSALGVSHTYDSELLTDQTNIIGAMVASLSGASIPFTCTDSNGYKEQRLHTATQLQQVFQAGMQHIVTNKTKYDSLKKLVEQATTVEQVNEVIW